MTKSIFDPAGGNPEHSGNRFTPPDANEISQLPQEFQNPPSPEASGTVEFQAPPEKPAVEVVSEKDGKLLVIHLTGKLHKADYQHFVPLVEEAVRQNGKVRILVQLHNFHGWDAAALWEDVKFDAKHFNDIERLAVVGEKAWEQWMAAFCKPFTTASVRYFPAEKEAEARAWMAA